MRLIDADALMERIASINNPDMLTIGKVVGTIDTQPTAYDIDKVVEELKDLGSKYCINVGCEYECKDCPHGILMQKEIEIVKQQA